MEIERRWKISGRDFELLASTTNNKKWIAQCYLSDKDSDLEVRLRGVEDKGNLLWFLTIKALTGDPLVRHEVERTVSKKEYESLVFFRKTPIINKLRMTLTIDSILMDFNKVESENPWYYVEIEFPSVEEARAFVAPGWFGDEVTTDPSYNMKNYAFEQKELSK